MRLLRKGSVVLAIVAGMVLVGAADAARAEDPVAFGSSPVVDSAGVLGDQTDEVVASLDAAAERSGRQLFVAYVDTFTNPEAADEWATRTAIDNNMGAEDYLLAVAVDGRAYYLSAASDASLSDAELDRISLEVIEPRLRDEDWAGAATAGAEAIAGDTGGGGIGAGLIWFLVIAAAVVIVVAIVLARRKRKRASVDAGGVPLPSIDDLRRRAGSALVQADDALKTSGEELGFAVASYGDEATTDFRTALESAKGKVAEAFTLQQRLDDAEPDTDDERRAWYGAIIQLTGEADALLDEQAERFDALRDLERNAPEALARVESAAAAAEGEVAPAAERLSGLSGQYGESALAPVADNPEQAQVRMTFARESLAAARTAVDAGQGGRAAVSIRAAEEAVDQAKLLSGAIERLAADLAAADQALAAGVAELDRDVQTARSLNTESTNAIADRVAAEASDIRSSIGRTRPRPARDADEARAGRRRDRRRRAGCSRRRRAGRASAGTARPQPRHGPRTGARDRGLPRRPPRRRRSRGAHPARRGRPAARAGRGHRTDRPGRSAHDRPARRPARPIGDVARPAGRRRIQRRHGRRLRRQQRRRRAAATSSARCSAASSSTRSSAAEAAAASAAAVSAAADSAAADGSAPGSFGGSGTRSRRGSGGRF